MFDMITNIMNNLLKKPATRNYPSIKRTPFKGSRGHIKGIDIDKCIFCGICQRKCPPNAINVNRNDKSWEIDPYKCIICGECVDVCPKKCILMEEQYASPATKKEKQKFIQEIKKVSGH